MTESFNKKFAHAMAPVKMLSVPVGTWPLQDYNVFSCLRCTLTILILVWTHLSPLIGILLGLGAVKSVLLVVVNVEFYLDRSDAGKNLDILVLGACDIAAIAKVLLFRVRCDGLVANFTSAVKDYDEVDGEEKEEIMRRHARMGRLACAGVIFFSYFGSTLFLTVAMFTEDDEVVNATQEDTPHFPVPSDYTMELLNVPTNWFMTIFVVEYAMLIIISTGNLGSDSLFFSIVFHLCGQVEILKSDFSRLEQDSEKAVDNFSTLVLRHQYLLNLADMLNDTISFIMAIQLAMSCLLTCMNGFQLILAMQDNNMLLIMKTSICLSALLMQLFAYSYIGDYLKCQMEEVGISAYRSGWYNGPKVLAKDVMFVIMRAQEPVQLMAGGFFCFNLENYISILKTSMSYLSVLRATVVS